MKHKVYVANKLPEEVKDYLDEHCECYMNTSEEIPSREYIIENYKDIEGLIQTGVKIDESFLGNMINLKAVSNVSVGYDNFDIESMKKREVIGTNTPGVLSDTVADLAMGLILSSARRIPEMDRMVKKGLWDGQNEKLNFGTDVHHSTLGIIGMGRIGGILAQRAIGGFDMKVLYYNRHRKEEAEKNFGVIYTSLNELLTKSDFVVLLTPLTKETYHLMDKEQFEMMKKSAMFINISRGKAVNEKALIEALNSKTIAGAALDVFEKEPVDSDNPLLKMDNVVTMPHIGSATQKTRFDMAMLSAKNMVMALEGQNPPNRVV